MATQLRSHGIYCEDVQFFSCQFAAKWGGRKKRTKGGGSSPNSKDMEHCTLFTSLHPFLSLQSLPPQQSPQKGALVALHLPFFFSFPPPSPPFSPADVVGKNLALKKPAQQSSTSNGGSPDKAVDGKCIGEWSKGSCTHTNHERNPWWLVDLGESRKIYAVMVKNRKDCCGQRLYEAEIHVGDSQKDNGRVNYL